MRKAAKNDGGVVTKAAALNLPALLSQVLVAFTIEFDNEAERRIPHWTTRHGWSAGSATGGFGAGPWLVSMAMWLNCMQFVGEDGIRVGELEERARTPTNLHGMIRWGYVDVAPDPGDPRAKPPRGDWVIRATARGRMAQEVWRPLFGVIEKRWEERFGESEIRGLRESLRAVLRQMDTELPDCMPILGYGLASCKLEKRRKAAESRASGHGNDVESESRLAVLLAKVLNAFAMEFDGESKLSLAICANVLRVLDEKGVRVRDLPPRSGVSKEGLSVATGYLAKLGLAAVVAEPGAGRGKMVRLTPKGAAARSAYGELTAAIEERWRGRFGANVIRGLRERLERLVGGGTTETSPLFRGLEPYPDGWRAAVRKPETLPHFPMVLHRGGFPDGS